MMIKRTALFVILVLMALPSSAQIKHGLRDENGRHVIARGFVVNTNDGKHDLTFAADDYVRMVRLGTNFQVVRLELGKLSTFPGCHLDETYLQKLDTLVRLGKHAGMKTVFKMTVYGVRDFSWEAFWQNRNSEQQTYLEAWQVVWERYQDEPSVYGYDLVNEPRKLDMDISYDDLTDDYLIPLYRKLIDQSNAINDTKMCLCQSIFQNKGDKTNENQYTEIKTPIGRENIVFAPHIYQDKTEWIKPTLERFDKESELLQAPIFIGEWGFPTFDTTDVTLTGRLGQLTYKEFYIHTAEEFDRMGVGSIKAWFLGSRTKQNFLPGGPSTWAIFSDEKSVGTVERKYITDIIARPYPQAIAGDIHSFMFDHATRSLDIQFTSDNSQGASRIFIGANRHYPDGFSVTCNEDFILCHNPLKAAGLEVCKADRNSNPADFIWDAARQQLVVLRWPRDKTEMHVRVVPGLHD